MKSNPNQEELYQSGIKGMKWGVRRFQNKDGTLTKAGKKRYNDVDSKDTENDQKETYESRRKRALASTDPKEIYENRDALSTAELNDKVNRIDTEARLKNKVVEGQAKTGIEKINDAMRNTTNTINNTKNLFTSIDQSYDAVAKSAIGKTISKKLGLEPPKKEFNFDEFWKNRNKKTTQELIDASNRINAEENIKNKMASKKTETQKKEESNKNKTSSMNKDDIYDMSVYGLVDNSKNRSR